MPVTNNQQEEAIAAVRLNVKLVDCCRRVYKRAGAVEEHEEA